MFVKGEGRPMILSRHDAHDLASSMKGDAALKMAEHFLSDPKLKGREGYTPTAAEILSFAKQIESLGRTMQTQYTSFRGVGENVRKHLPIHKKALDEIAGQTDRVTSSQVPVVGEAIDKAFAQSIGLYLKSMDDTASTNSVINKLTSHGKQNLTVVSAATWGNIIFANLLAVSTARGNLTPVGLVSSLMSVMTKMGKYRRGEATAVGPKANALDKRAFKSISQTGKLKTSLIDAEISTIMNPDPSFNRPYRMYKEAVGKMAKGYQWLDSSFKLEIAYRNWHRINKDMQDLAPGVDFNLIVNGRTKRAVKQKDGSWQVNGKKASQESVDRFVAHHSFLGADNILFDMTKAPLFLQHMRTGSVFPLVSLFTSWAWKAIDIPFIGKKGLVHGIMLGDYIAPATKSRPITMRNMQRAAMLTARRSMLYGAAIADIESRQPDELRRMLRPMGVGPAAVLIQNVTDPSNAGDEHVAFKNFQHMSWAQPTQLGLTLAQGAWISASEILGRDYDLVSPAAIKATKEAEKMWHGTPEERKKAIDRYLSDEKAAGTYTKKTVQEIKNRRRLFVEAKHEKHLSLSNLLTFFQMSGQPLVEFIIRGADPRAKDRDILRLSNSLSSMALGATPYRALDVAASEWSENSLLSTRHFALSEEDPSARKPLVRWQVDRLFGQAWKMKNFNKTVGDDINRMKRAIEDSFSFAWEQKISALENDIRDKYQQGRHEEASALITEMERLQQKAKAWEEIVAEVLEDRTERLFRVWDKIKE